jgi:hypothetical protein
MRPRVWLIRTKSEDLAAFPIPYANEDIGNTENTVLI